MYMYDVNVCKLNACKCILNILNLCMICNNMFCVSKVCIYICMYVCMYACMYVCICMYMYVLCMYMYDVYV